MKHLPIILCGLLATGPARAAVTATTFDLSWSGTLPVPDNNATGASNTLTFTAPEWSSIQVVTVELRFTGGWNGDLYAYVAHNGQLAILLNRPGRTAANGFGSGSTDLVAVFSDAAAADVHTALPDSGPATGTWQPDGRFIDPLDALDTTPRTKMLDGFTGRNPNGDWTLFIADQGAGDTATLTGWTLSITAVPEPSAAMLGGMAALLVLRRKRG
ncbi:MAG: proprotein convertase P-domain-containing protein [Akkermansiaceae bacterium]|jgi:subtilisin-like proprotein convertase family protein|nr:proprotein convertase P-domain-containing protein [Akkermansiaceae bacterium]